MTTRKQILVVDDEETLCDALAFNLESEGYGATTAYSAEDALTLDLTSFDLILLDIMMGEISGLQLAKILKANPMTANIPVIFCTAKNTEEDLIEGLDSGGDDYIAKPYSLKEMLARIRSVLRRAAATSAPSNDNKDTISYKGLVLSLKNRSCTVDGIEVKMPKKEFEILLKLMSNREQVFSRAELLHDIWPDEVVVLDRVVDVNITRIRQKLGSYGKNIITRSGYGYGFFE